VRGLPPAPHGVGRLTLQYLVDLNPCSSSWWFFAPGSAASDVAWAESVADDVFLLWLGTLANLHHRGAQLVACHIELNGPPLATRTVYVGPGDGAIEGAQALNVAMGLRPLGSVAGKGTAGTVRLPGVPDEFIQDSAWLSQRGYTQLRDRGADWMNGFNLLPAPLTGTLVLGTLHRVHSGVALDPPLFDAAFDIVPSDRVCTLRRRIPRAHRVSSVPGP
jgi:hypothetical protein